MNNIYLFKDFVNEGLFGSKWSDIVDKVYNYIQKMPIDELVRNTDKHRCEFVIRRNYNNNPNDPYNEEDWDDNKAKINVRINFETITHYPELIINGDELDREVRKLEKLIKKRVDDKEQENIEQRVKNLDF